MYIYDVYTTIIYKSFASLATYTLSLPPGKPVRACARCAICAAQQVFGLACVELVFELILEFNKVLESEL